MDQRRWSGDGIRDYAAERVFSDADRHVISILERTKPDTVLELGCGPGVICNRSSFIRDYICTDKAHGFLKITGTHSPGRAVVCCDACELPFSEETTDCVLAMAVLHHLDSNALGKALHEVHRVLKDGGQFILLEDWCFSSGETVFEEEARRIRFKYGTCENHLAAGTWLYLLESSGFTCSDEEWVRRPFHSSDARLLGWPESERTVRMCCFTGVKSR